nr:hypothetical protein [Clostridium neonatale]
MKHEEILKALRDKHMLFGVSVITSNGEKSIIATEVGWQMKTAFGYFEYTTEELADELVGWGEEILYID